MEYIYINQELGIDSDGVQGTLSHDLALWHITLSCRSLRKLYKQEVHFDPPPHFLLKEK